MCDPFGTVEIRVVVWYYYINVRAISIEAINLTGISHFDTKYAVDCCEKDRNKLMEIYDILDMLDWNKPLPVQQKGIMLAANIKDIHYFMQPLTLRHGKNVWDNCALIVTQRTDDELRPFLCNLFEWLQDMNWPGADRIYDRLIRISHPDLIRNQSKTLKLRNPLKFKIKYTIKKILGRR